MESSLFFDLRWSSDELCGSPKWDFFWDACEDSLSMVHLFIIINENFTQYSSNITSLSTNYRNKYILTVSSKKIIGNMLFLVELIPPPPRTSENVWNQTCVIKNSVYTMGERDFIDSCVFSTRQYSPFFIAKYQFISFHNVPLDTPYMFKISILYIKLNFKVVCLRWSASQDNCC